MRSKLNFLTSILTASLLTIIMGGLSTMMILVSLKMVEDGKSDSLFKTPIYAAIVFVGLLIWVIWIYLKNCKTVILSNKGLHIKSVLGSTFYQWSEVKSVSLLDKHYLYGSAMEATTIKFKNGEVYHFMPFYYSNADYLRRCLSKANLSSTPNSIDFETLKNRNPRSLQKIDYSEMKKIGGNPVFSFNGIFLYTVLGFVIYQIVFNPSENFLNQCIGLGFAGLLFFYWLGYQLHYFYIDDKNLVVKNYVWIWRTKRYPLNQIKQGVFEMPHKMSTSFRIVNTDFTSKLFPGGSIRTKNWVKFIEKLKKNKISVRNEAVY